MKELSIIIPVYNCALVIERCLNSINYLDAEIIVVDDGSTDSTHTIVEGYALSHQNIILLRQQHVGVSSARNLGLENANGKYICFVDADDFLSTGGLERILQLAIDNDADVVKYKVNHLKNVPPIKSITDVSSTPIYTKRFCGKGAALMSNEISDYHVIDGLFKTQLLRDNNIHFRSKLHIHEDDVFMCEVYCCSTNVIGTSLPLYNYIVASDFSSTHTKDIKSVEVLVNSSVLAVHYRQSALETLCPNVNFPFERYKCMRYVMNAYSTMMQNHYPYSKMKAILMEFKKLNVWPVEYKWIKIAGLTNKKLWVKSFLCNHPLLSYCCRFWYS